MKLIDRIKTILYTLMFVTIVGAGFGVYHLYEDKDKALFLSLIAPNEWDRPYIGSFKLQTDGKWEKTSQE